MKIKKCSKFNYLRRTLSCHIFKIWRRKNWLISNAIKRIIHIPFWYERLDIVCRLRWKYKFHNFISSECLGTSLSSLSECLIQQILFSIQSNLQFHFDFPVSVCGNDDDDGNIWLVLGTYSALSYACGKYTFYTYGYIVLTYLTSYMWILWTFR